MKALNLGWGLAAVAIAVTAGGRAAGQDVVLEITSPYHHIKVIDDAGIRTLSFDGSMETRMSLADPLKGYFEYTEYFHMPWLWNAGISNVLMFGLGGGSVLRAYQHYYPDVKMDSVEIDPIVVQVAREYFHVKDSANARIQVEDGRVYLRRTRKQYDVMILDAYAKNRYGSFIPYHLVTKEFFVMARSHLTTNGVLAYNVIGSVQGYRADLLGAVYKTMKSVFPQVYLFPASDSYNVVLVATNSKLEVTSAQLHQRARDLVKRGRRLPPTLTKRIYAYRKVPPATAHSAKILTDDFAPVDGLLRTLPK